MDEDAPSVDDVKAEGNTTGHVDKIPEQLAAYSDFLRRNSCEHSDAIAAAYQVYEDLRLIRKWTHLKLLHDHANTTNVTITGVAPATLDAVYGGARARVVRVFHARDKLKVSELHKLGQGEYKDERCVTVAIVDDDSTTAYYRLFTKFEEITHPQWKSKKEKEDAGKDDEEESSEDEEEELECDAAR